MGMWDFEAWDNDAAADWFGDLMEATQLRAKWLEGIKTNIEDEPEIPRAAVWLFAQLGRVYIWPIEKHDEDLELAIKTGEELANREWLVGEAPEYIKKLKEDIEIIKNRRKT